MITVLFLFIQFFLYKCRYCLVVYICAADLQLIMKNNINLDLLFQMIVDRSLKLCRIIKSSFYICTSFNDLSVLSVQCWSDFGNDQSGNCFLIVVSKVWPSLITLCTYIDKTMYKTLIIWARLSGKHLLCVWIWWKA